MITKKIEGSFPVDSSTESSTVSLGVFEQVKWERDVAIEQLKELGYGLGEKPKTGEWQQDRDGTYLCSECGSGFKKQPTVMGKPMFLYCPLCGVRMKKGEENEC